MAIDTAPAGAPNGEPEGPADKAPVAVSMVNTVTLPPANSVTVRAPVASLMAKIPTVLEALLATYRNLPLGSTASATGAAPVDANAGPGTGVRNPLAESMENAEIVLAL